MTEHPSNVCLDNDMKAYRGDSERPILEVVPADFARTLERELIEARALHANAIALLNDETLKLLAANEDKARLDWLELTAEGVHWQLHGDRDIVTRKAIDAEMGAVTFKPGDCLKSGTYNGPTAAFLYDPKANTAKEIPPP